MKFRLLVGTVAVSTLLLALPRFSQQPPDPSRRRPPTRLSRTIKTKPPADASAKTRTGSPPVIQQPDDSSVKHDAARAT